MNPEMEKRIQEARDAGYTEEEIQAELAILQGTAAAPEVAPQTPIDRSEEYAALGQGVGAETALNAAKLAGLGLAGGYALKKVGDIVRGPVAPTPPTAPGATQRILSQAMGRPGAVPPGTVSPGQPLVDFVQQQGKYAPPAGSAPAAPSPQTTASGRPFSPQAQEFLQQRAAAPAQQPNMMQRGMQYADRVRQIAMDKVVQNAGGLAKAGVGLGAMMYSPGLNQGEDEELARRRAMAPTIR